MKRWLSAPLSALVVALLGCSRAAPLASAPQAAAGGLRTSNQPVNPQHMKGAESFGNGALLAVEQLDQALSLGL